MALVAYSDSEGSDTEEVPTPAPAPSKPAPKISDKPSFQKLTKPSEGPRKIKVDLPNVQPAPGHQDEQPPAKRARTAGAFSGFNSLLPAPKQPAKAAPKAGVSLKTSSEAVFSRAPPNQSSDWNGDDEANGDGVEGGERGDVAVVKEEPKLVGRATKFKPLSVSNKKKTVKKLKVVEDAQNGSSMQNSKAPAKEDAAASEAVAAAPPPPKPKRSLFSMPAAEEPIIPDMADEDDYIQPDGSDPEAPSAPTRQPTQLAPAASNPNSLQSVADSMNLTPAQRRQLFGRNSKNQDINVANFNLDAEYASNEQLRQAGETVEHRAVKAIAPGKHSLQQLVNNARTQQEGLEDKWAAGRQSRGEGGSKYGWGGR